MIPIKATKLEDFDILISSIYEKNTSKDPGAMISELPKFAEPILVLKALNVKGAAAP